MGSFDLQSLPAETRQWLEAKVKAGAFAGADDFLRDLLVRLQRFEVEDEAEIRRLVAEGLDDLECGHEIPGEQAFAELRAEHYGKFGRHSGS